MALPKAVLQSILETAGTSTKLSYALKGPKTYQKKKMV